MSDSFQDSASKSGVGRRTRRRVLAGLNAGAAVLLAGVLVVMVNYLSSRHYYRADVSREQYYGLSEKTRSLLESLTNRIDVVVFFQPSHMAYEDVDNLLKEYEYAAPPGMLRVERVDPNRNLARTEELARKYQVSELNVVVFDNAGRNKFITANDLLEMDYSMALRGGAPEQIAFKGEQAFSSAIQSITQARKPIVYFVGGHGERDIEDRDPYKGYSAIAQQVRRDNVEVRTVMLADKPTLPEDADALILAGTRKKISQPELDLLRAYLEKSGRLMVLLDGGADTGLAPLLEEWDVRASNEIVVDPTRTLSGLDLYIADYGSHPITRNLMSVTTVFYLPCPVEPISEKDGAAHREDKPQVTPLAFSSERSWAERDLDQKPMRFDNARDRKGPLSIAVAVEKGPVRSVEVDIRPTRMVIVGDSDFASNGALSGGNIDFVLSALNWLLEREQLLAIAPKSTEASRLIMNRDQLALLFWAIVVGMPTLVAALGALVWLRRRS